MILLMGVSPYYRMLAMGVWAWGYGMGVAGMGPDAVRRRFAAVAGQRLQEVSERLDWAPERLRVHREHALQRSLAAAAVSSAWYAQRLDGLDPTTATVEDLRAVPPMTKADLMEHWDAIVCVDGLRLADCQDALAHGRVVVDDENVTVTSSGSSGRPAVVVYSVDELATEWATYLRLLLRWAEQQGRKATPRAGLVGAPPGPHISTVIGWLQGVEESGRFSVGDPLDGRLVPGLNAIDPELLAVYPSVLPALLGATRAGTLQIRPQLVLTIAEPVLGVQVDEIRELWGSAVAGNWATTEVGMLGTGDCVNDGLVLHDDHVVIEAVDRHGEPVADGTPADKVFVTTLSRRVLPLVRYEVTDQLTISGVRHGEGFRRSGDVQGRLDDGFLYDGRLLHPSLLRSALASPGVADYQLQQTETGVRIFVIANDRLDAQAIASNAARSLEGIGVIDPRVEVLEVTTLQRDDRSGKLRRFVPLSSTTATAAPTAVTGARQ